MSKDVATLELDYSEIAKRINIALSTLGKLYEQTDNERNRGLLYKLIGSTLFLHHLIRSGAMDGTVVLRYLTRIEFYTVILEDRENMEYFPNTLEYKELFLQKEVYINSIFNNLYSMHMRLGDTPKVLAELRELQVKSKNSQLHSKQVDLLYNLFNDVLICTEKPFIPTKISLDFKVFIDALEYCITTRQTADLYLEEDDPIYDAYSLAIKIHHEAFHRILRIIFAFSKDRISSTLTIFQNSQRTMVSNLSNPGRDREDVNFVMIITELMNELQSLEERLSFVENVLSTAGDSRLNDMESCYLLLAIVNKVKVVTREIGSEDVLSMKTIGIIQQIKTNISDYLDRNPEYLKIAS